MRKYTLFLFFVLVSAQLMSQSAKNTVVFKVRKPHSSTVKLADDKSIITETVKEVFVVVEENATFMGGDLESFRGWVLEHLVYPESAANLGLEGKVILSFVVNPQGVVERTVVLRGVNPVLDKEAIRVVNSSPKWVPGKQAGKLVSQQFTIPIAFKLQK